MAIGSSVVRQQPGRAGYGDLVETRREFIEKPA
jgi:hypothetical protein